MSVRLRRLIPLCPAPSRSPPPDAHVPAGGSDGNPASPGIPGDSASASAFAGAKAARLSAARRAGFPVLPGWVVPPAESRPAVRAAAAVLRGGQPGSARRAVLSRPLDPGLAAELGEAAARLGTRVIVRSSSQLESDPRWSGAFSSVADVRPDEVATAVRSCWASAFAVDPLARLDACGLPAEALELGVLIQPEIRPAAGGVAKVTPAGAPGPVTWADGSPVSSRPASQGGIDVIVEGAEGHPAPLLTGWAEGATALVNLRSPGGSFGQKTLPGQRAMTYLPDDGARAVANGPLIGLIGRELVLEVARLAEAVYRLLGDDTIEWAVQDGHVWLFQCRRTADPPHAANPVRPGPGTFGAPGSQLVSREMMPLLSAAIRACGGHLRGRPAVAGEAAGRLVACRPHERPPADFRDAILLIDRPLPAFAPLLFTARGVIARSGNAASHLAEVARSLAVPMVTGCRPESVTRAGPPGARWLAAIDGATGGVALCRSEDAASGGEHRGPHRVPD